MNRSAGTMVLCLALGAAVMYGSSNFRLRVEPLSPSEVKAPPPAAPQADEPRHLPREVTGKPTPAAPTFGGLRQVEGEGVVRVLPVKQVTESIPVPGNQTKTVAWKSVAGTPIRLFTSNPTIVLDTTLPADAKLSIGLITRGSATPLTKDGVQPAGITVALPSITFDFTKFLPSGFDGPVSIVLQVRDAAGALQAEATIAMAVPGQAPADRPIVDRYSNSPYLPPKELRTDTTPVELFGTFFQLHGRVPQPQMSFVVQLDNGFAEEFAADSQPAQPGLWSAGIRGLREMSAGSTGFIAVRSQMAADRHTYSTERVLFVTRPSIARFNPPTVTLKKRNTDNTPGAELTRLMDASGRGQGNFASNTPALVVTVKAPAGAQGVILYVDDKVFPKPLDSIPTADTDVAFTPVDLGMPAIQNTLRAEVVRGDSRSDPTIAVVEVRASGPVIDSALSPGLGTGGGIDKITLRVVGTRLTPVSAETTSNYKITHVENETRTVTVTAARYDPVANIVTLTVSGILPGSYKVTVPKGAAPTLVDEYGNPVQVTPGAPPNTYFETVLFTTRPDQPLPSQTAGVTLQTGPPVYFPEYVKFRVSPDGFNPSDRVETRVVRLYYFRDAHRVAQIVNRTVKSYNAATVDVRRRAADRGRDEADQATDERKRLEAAAVRAAQDSRAAEAELNAAQNRVQTARGQAIQARDAVGQLQARLSLIQNDPTRTAEIAQLRSDIVTAQQALSTAAGIDQQGPAEIARLQNALAAKRDTESKALEAWQVKELVERRLREGQFRAEVAAAREDPDTYAPGDPNSNDPVMQVSVSVIGEGLIQLRGPIKGLNVIRTMVNQIDSPVGQVRIAVHTLQVNGERADRMEKVIANIQRYLDHSRFLTAQSGQMLKRAITSVASRKAFEVQSTLAPGCSQWDRDQRYLYAFFGKDFTDELSQLDSEFLKTGNKLLSLNSMDSTSLSAALFLLALAKNDVRTEIINEFIALVQRELPEAEWNYYMAGISDLKCCEACKDKKQYLLAYNSKFQSFIGFFTSETQVADTLTPLQREFIRLAQVFKARMITEMQLKQRVMERSLLEERVGTVYLEELKKAKKLEDDAKEALRKVGEQRQIAQEQLSKGLIDLFVEFSAFEIDVRATYAEEPRIRHSEGVTLLEQQTSFFVFMGEDRAIPTSDPNTEFSIGGSQWEDVIRRWDAAAKLLQTLVFPDYEKEAKQLIALLQKLVTTKKTTLAELRTVTAKLKEIFGAVFDKIKDGKNRTNALLAAIQDNKATFRELYEMYTVLKDDTLKRLKGPTLTRGERAFALADQAFQTFGGAELKYQNSLKQAQAARRPLDEKKLLDMLVDEMEDKFIEILEGTRAHTANIDNYMKTVATALDDDFNTQYYLPSFRRAREASRYWDVTLAQIETTSVLTNNRMLGKVSPAASFEFDLPKRDILITEGFKSAKALVDEYGALVNDPSFLALAKIYSGNPVSMMQGGGGGFAAVRNVLPGLPTSPDEKMLAQAGPGRKEFGSSLDALIPDPAIYKFETGTGFEIRPVLSPDGQAVVFNFDYMYTTDVREPVRADEKHLGRVKRHFVHTDVQLSNFELREVSKYLVALKVARTGKGVQLLQDIPGVGVLFRPLPSAGASLQQNLIYSQATIFPTLFDLMGLRYAPAVADLDPLADRSAEFAARYRRLDLEQRIYDIGATRVDDALRTPYGERRYDLYRPQVSLPFRHPNGYAGPGLRLKDGKLVEDFNLFDAFPPSQFAPTFSPESRPPHYPLGVPYGPPGGEVPLPSHVPGHGGYLPGYGVPTYAAPATPLSQPRPYQPPVMPQPVPPGGAVRPGVPATPGVPSFAGRPGTSFPTNPPVNSARPVPYPPPPYPPPSFPPNTGVPRAREMPNTSLPPVITPGVPSLTPPPVAPMMPLAPLAPLAPTGR